MGSNQRMAAAGFNNQTQTSQQHYLHHSLTPHPTLPPHPHHSHSPQSMVQHQLQSSSSTSSNPSSSSPSIPPNGSPFSSMLSQQQAPPPSSSSLQQPQQSPQPLQPVQNQGSTSLQGAMMQTTNSVPTPPGSSSFASASNNNSLNNLPNTNNNSAGSTQSSCHYSAHSSSHNQDSNLSTTSAGSHCSDKQEPPVHCDTLHAHTPEKRALSQADPTTPTGANGALANSASTGSQRKRRKKDEPPPPSQERANSIGSKRGEKKVTDYFKVNYTKHNLVIPPTFANLFGTLFPNAFRTRVLVDTMQLAPSRRRPVHSHITCTNSSRQSHRRRHFLPVPRRHPPPLPLTTVLPPCFTTINCRIHLPPLRAGLPHCSTP